MPHPVAAHGPLDAHCTVSQSLLLQCHQIIDTQAYVCPLSACNEMVCVQGMGG